MTYKFSCFVNTLKLALHAKKETSGVIDLLQSGGSIVRHYKHRGIASLSHLQVHIQFEPVKLIQDVDTHWNFEYQHDACKTVTYMMKRLCWYFIDLSTIDKSIQYHWKMVRVC